jgi:cold shock CspA family protein
MPTGRIITWNYDRGFGFIARDDRAADDRAADVFAHIKFCVPGFQPAPGAHVSFEVIADERSPANRGRANNVQLMSSLVSAQ